MRRLLERAAAGLGALEARLRSPKLGAFEPTRYVWSRGLGLLCDHNGGIPFVRGQRGGRAALRFDAELFSRVRDGDLVWVRSIALPQFLDEALPKIRARFALVTGDEDWSIPGGFERSREILEHEQIAYWFTQNLDDRAPSPKLQPLPIGVDFHTISNGPKWGQPQATPAEQEAELSELRKTMLRSEQRLLEVHADFHFHKHKPRVSGDDRHSVEALLRPNALVQFQETKLPRAKLWQEKTRFAFVVSPHGNGLDCHRTWESLLLGNIVIVKRSSLDALYAGLPVVIVDDWREIDEDSLKRWRATHAPAFEQPEVEQRLTNGYWIDRMRRMLADRLNGGC